MFKKYLFLFKRVILKEPKMIGEVLLAILGVLIGYIYITLHKLESIWKNQSEEISTLMNKVKNLENEKKKEDEIIEKLKDFYSSFNNDKVTQQQTASSILKVFTSGEFLTRMSEMSEMANMNTELIEEGPKIQELDILNEMNNILSIDGPK